ncbi:MAG: Molybdenum ABC transporter, periplasmic molybdenum-binding protein ModA (TC 3.A.1.8.1) [uncultured Sulfurovum sp.]|uniref:Molybdenum ABC transporter, periplasmic molybdenum-binding protein ModA (TC 3.A.1.8.1) n=1 Tax=uncultured Sulfurovum sp. TaxID=269237 RepID=A0A6S6U5Z6_9BACT|nr:MAG: Molybdenum ABC transporter, periplasmic molybdenum-binding protein ModA (TC 3.A.1.8.1) [uncultured Sulfurovum sp.]
MKFKLLLLTLLSSFIMAETITVAVAANVSYAINDLKKEFNKLYPNINVQVILGGTGKLVAQIKHKAPYHILMAANMMYPKKLYESGDAVTRPLVYAQGSLAYLSTKNLDLSKGMELLLSDKVKKIAIANPKTAPYGVASVKALKNAKVYDATKSKFVYGESISQTVIYATKATDIGLIAKSALYSPKMAHFKKDVHWKEVDAKFYTPIDQGIVLLKHGEKSLGASAFYAFIMSKRAKEVFEDFGYSVPAQSN